MIFPNQILSRIAVLLLPLANGLLLPGCNNTEPANAPETAATPVVARAHPRMNPMQKQIYNTNFSEELVLNMTPGLKLIGNQLSGESPDLKSLFLENFEYLGPAEFNWPQERDQAWSTSSNLVAHVDWPLMSESVSRIQPDNIWQPLTNEFRFTDVQFGILSGKLLDDRDVFRMKTSFEGRAVDDQQRVYGIKGKQTLEWFPTADGRWNIGKWHQDKLELLASPKTLFEDVTDQAIPEKNVGEILSRSRHEELIVYTARQPVLKRASKKYPPFSDWQNLYQYPSVSVVDLDQDQWDDLFVTDRWGESILLRNNGDQTFTDISEASGLKFDEAFANCALFVDFDNDGDSDVLVGRTVEPSQFFRNDNGKFVPHDGINEILKDIKFVSSASVADINRDGLLDVYLSTYCYTADAPLGEWTREAVREEDRNRLQFAIEHGQVYLDRGGPPNIVLMNRGTTFDRVKIDDELKQWKNSFQSAWLDVDNDGDLDLYVCNDFAPDAFLRNDTAQGSFEPKFGPFKDDVFPADSMGFGMGASLGDYNSDGQLDLYVSNMYSKAGHRVFEQMGGDVDPRIRVSAEGSYLFENKGGKFKQVAGLKDGTQHVSKVGWSFGGQFADFDNDGKLDIYAPSGFYSAPRSIDGEVDL